MEAPSERDGFDAGRATDHIASAVTRPHYAGPTPPRGAATARSGWRRNRDTIAFLLFFASVVVGILGLAVLLVDVLSRGLPWLDWDFINNFPSRHAEESGVKAALWGTIWIMFLTALFTIPLGISTAIYLEEFAADNWRNRIIRVNIANLAGVPSIIYGLLGLAVFVQWWGLGRSVIAGALTMTLLILPVVIIASQEAIKSVPQEFRDGAYALGATKWQVSKRIVLPLAVPGIMSGVILALSRAIGEAAPMITISALVFLTFTPSGPTDRFTVLPIQIFNWVGLPQDDFRGVAAAGIIVLLVVLLAMNSLAIFVRNKFQKRY
ncbi:MAG: phosphate ABC transporter permease PstA [Chloroflexi bacterium]|nr:phosphate ABC transporter permease PstA [Chloroflexota bacterium]